MEAAICVIIMGVAMLIGLSIAPSTIKELLEAGKDLPSERE